MKRGIILIHNDILHYSILSLFSIFVIFSFYLCANRYFIHPDASYYLGVSYLLLDGKVPFVDFRVGYTPLSFYLMCIPLKIIGKKFATAIIVLYTIHLINTLLLFLILRKQKVSLKWAWFGSLLFIMNCFVFEGLFYVLEPFVVLFGLLSLFFVQRNTKKDLLLAGLFCACSFLCKQYGLGFLCLNVIYVVVQNNYSKHGVRGFFFILSGFIVGIVLFVMTMMAQGVTPAQMLDLSGSNYEKNGLGSFISAWIYLLKRVAPVYLAMSVAAWYYKKVIRNGFWIVSLFGIIGFVLPCMVRFYIHYLLLALPFIVFLVVYSISQIQNKHFKVAYIILLIVTTLRPFVYIIETDRRLINEDLRKEQEMTSQKIAEYIPLNQPNVFVSSRALPISLINSYQPPLLGKYGMSNGFVDRPEEVMDLLTHSDFALLTGTDRDNQRLRYTPAVKDYLANSFNLKKIQAGNENFYIYVKK